LVNDVIPLIHHTAMWAARFHLVDAPVRSHSAATASTSSLSIVVIGVGSLMLIILAVAIAFLRRTRANRTAVVDAAQDGEARFRILAEAIPQIVWTATPEGSADYCNRRWYELTGFTEEQTLGAGWLNAIHPDDQPVAARNWANVLPTGEPFEMEYRVQNATGGFRWQLARATPMRDSAGTIVKWFGGCTDIEEQRHTQQLLEDQIRDRTAELADANTRLQEEMWERDQARRQLDEQNEKMVQQLTERSQRATLLAKMGELMQSCVSKDEVFAAALGFAPKIFPTSRGAVALLNPARSLAEVAGSWNECQLPRPVFESASCWALRTGHPHLVIAGDSTATCAHAAGVEDTYLCIPILAQGEALGILHFQATKEAPSLPDAELPLKTTFAAQVGLSVANIRLREALRTQSIRDPLTGLYNRRYLTETLEREIRRAVRAEQSLGVLMLDLDHFKRFNDTYGHDAGDSVLRETASFLSKSIRIEDTVCRFGGEEFVVILPTADLAAAHARAERIRSKLHELIVLHQGQSLGTITVSVGVAALPVHGTTPKELLDAADAALYRAKRDGRDRVVDADPVPLTDVQPDAVGMANSAIS
jgi:diguanylate cyclase (GGDEF)-like protein/PAS domain S-box-containing protein